MDVNPGSAPSRQDRRERVLGILLLGAIRVCCRLFVAPRPEPVLATGTAASREPSPVPADCSAHSGHEDRGPPHFLFLSFDH